MRDMCGKVMILLFAAIPVVRSGDFNFLNYLEGFGEFLGEYPQCRHDLQKLRDGAERSEIWALQMLDASTKFPPGLMTGNLIDYGNYDECLNARPNGTGIVPQHCVATIDLPRNRFPDNSSLGIPVAYRWSYCVPESCPPNALQELLSRIAGTFSSDVNVSVLPSDCHTGTGHSLSAPDIIGISVWSGIAVLAVASTIYDAVNVMFEMEKNPWLTSFSLFTNATRLLNTEVSRDTLAPLNGLRFLSIAWIVLGHRYFFSTTVGVMNLEEVPREFEKIYFQIFAGGVLAVDTFFLLSGLLNSYLMLKTLERTKKFPIAKYYIHRYLRLTPALAAVVLMYSTWFVLLGNGPGWERTTSYWKKLCVDHWWPTLLYINNYYNPVNQCAGQSWYLAVDMQLYWLAPLVILPIWKRPKIAKYYLGGLLLSSTVCQFLVAYIYKFRMSFSISMDEEESKRVTELLYVPTHTRATPYIIGMMLGVYLDGISNRPEKPKWPKIWVLLGWLLSAATCLSVVFGNYPFFRSPEYHPYDRLESSFYISLHRIGWGAGISWVILACLFGYGGVANSILSWKAFVPLSRLTYCIFLCHMAVQQYQLGTTRTTGYYQMFDEIHRYFGDLVSSVLAAAVLSLLFESPVTVLERLVLGKEKNTKNLQSYTNKAFQET